MADRLGLEKPTSIIGKFLIPLSGAASGKASSSDKKDKPIFLNDDEKTIIEKVHGAFSGCRGNGTEEEHKRLGGNLETDVSFQYLLYFEEDDEILADIAETFSKGVLSCSEIK